MIHFFCASVAGRSPMFVSMVYIVFFFVEGHLGKTIALNHRNQYNNHGCLFLSRHFWWKRRHVLALGVKRHHLQSFWVCFDGLRKPTFTNSCHKVKLQDFPMIRLLSSWNFSSCTLWKQPFFRMENGDFGPSMFWHGDLESSNWNYFENGKLKEPGFFPTTGRGPICVKGSRSVFQAWFSEMLC